MDERQWRAECFSFALRCEETLSMLQPDLESLRPFSTLVFHLYHYGIPIIKQNYPTWEKELKNSTF